MSNNNKTNSIFLSISFRESSILTEDIGGPYTTITLIPTSDYCSTNERPLILLRLPNKNSNKNHLECYTPCHPSTKNQKMRIKINLKANRAL